MCAGRCLITGPLLISTDLRLLDNRSLAILTNTELIGTAVAPLQLPPASPYSFRLHRSASLFNPCNPCGLTVDSEPAAAQQSTKTPTASRVCGSPRPR